MGSHFNCGNFVTFSPLHFFSRYNDLLSIDSSSVRAQEENATRDEHYPFNQQGILRVVPPHPFGPPPSSYSTSNILSFSPGSNLRRPRGEKKPIPEDMKDERYFERRKRNNLAAKKSRDARKIREDQIALRATILEQENAVLRAQVFTLKEEAHSLRQLLLLHRKSSSQPYSCLTSTNSS